MTDYFLGKLLFNPWAGRNISVLQMSFRNHRHDSTLSACPAGLPATKQTGEMQSERNVFVVLWKLSTHWGRSSILGA